MVVSKLHFALHVHPLPNHESEFGADASHQKWSVPVTEALWIAGIKDEANVLSRQ